MKATTPIPKFSIVINGIKYEGEIARVSYYNFEREDHGIFKDYYLLSRGFARLEANGIYGEPFFPEELSKRYFKDEK